MKKRSGIYLSIGLLLLVLAVAILVNMGESFLPTNWHIVTRHSDTPPQVIRGIEGLEEEARFRILELQKAVLYARKHAEDARAGIGESGEVVDAKRRAELLELAPQWDAAAARAEQAVAALRAL